MRQAEIIKPESPEMQKAADVRLERRAHGGRARDPFRCAYCGSSYHLLSFTAIYGNGSSTSRYRKGLILKTGWAETKKQTLMAEKCSPPKKHGQLGYVLLASVASAIWSEGGRLNLKEGILQCSSWVMLASLVALGVAMWWNLTRHSKKLTTWSDSYFCKRCGKVSVITALAS